MGLILKDSLTPLMKGYPSVSDKYNVRGATLSSESEIGYFGNIVTFKGDGYFKVASETSKITSANQVAGVLLATNVKLVTDFFGGASAKAETRPGEAFNLLIGGYVALEVDVAEDSKASDALALCVEGVDAKITANGKVSTTGTIDCGWKFTGVTCIDDNGTPLAEVVVFPRNI